mgnify:CR=1 FL=1
MDDEEESYATGLSHILRDARGPPTDIADFEDAQPELGSEVSEQIEVVGTTSRADVSSDEGGNSRLMRMRTAALIAVLSVTGMRPASRGESGRRLGSAWAQDHRRRRMGLSGLASHRSKRARWR